MTRLRLRTIWKKTNGHCHFCGDRLFFDRRGHRRRSDGSWEVDHVIQRDRGGVISPDNCLPACTGCNRLRWHRGGGEIRQLMRLGILARGEIEKKSELAAALIRKAPRSLMLAPEYYERREKMISFLRKHRRRAFTAAELGGHTGVPKKFTKRLLETSRKVSITWSGRGYLFQGRAPKRRRARR